MTSNCVKRDLNRRNREDSASRYALLAAAAAVTSAGSLIFALVTAQPATGGHGLEALSGRLLVALAVGCALLCLYLTLIWTLAAVTRLWGDRPIGRSSLQALRVLAPSLARRVALGAAAATTLGGLALGPASAVEAPHPDPAGPGASAAVAEPGQALRSGAVLGYLPLEGDRTPGPENPPAPEPGAPQNQQPELGWAPPQAEPEVAPAPSVDDGPESDAADPTEPTDPPRVAEVRPGDSLWEITDRLLGPGPDDPDDIAQFWPELYSANRNLIGPDPDHLEPGQVLSIPEHVPAHQEKK